MKASTAAAPSLTPGSFQACPSCQAPIEFDPSSGGLKCPYCATTKAIAAGPVPYHRVQDALGVATADDARFQTLRCTHCGATSKVGAAVVTTRCPFCEAPLAGASVASAPPAEGVLPFALRKEEAAASFARWLRRLWFRPSNLRRLARLQALQGIYIPNWSFDAEASSQWTAEAGYYYDVEERVMVNGREEIRKKREIRWVPASGHHEAQYTDLLVSASAGLAPAELAALEPFELGRLTRFDDDFLAGFQAETHARSVLDSWKEAASRIASEERSACARQVPGDTHRNLMVSTETSRQLVRSLLVPVYVSAYDYSGKLYRVVVNGQTGKVSGQAPWSPWKIAAFILFLAALGFVIYTYAQTGQLPALPR